MTGDRSALSLEANANYFRENLFHRASLCWLGRKDQIYSPRFSHLASLTFLSLLLSYTSVSFLFLSLLPQDPLFLFFYKWLRHSPGQEQAKHRVLRWQADVGF